MNTQHLQDLEVHQSILEAAQAVIMTEDSSPDDFAAVLLEIYGEAEMAKTAVEQYAAILNDILTTLSTI